MSLEIGKYVEYLTYVSSCVLPPLQVWLVTLQEFLCLCKNKAIHYNIDDLLLHAPLLLCSY